MDEKSSPAESAFLEALALDLNTDKSDPIARRSACEKIIGLHRSALELGLKMEDEILSRTYLALRLSEMVSLDDKVMEVMEKGMDSVPYAARAVSEFEKALILDSQHNSVVFGNPVNRTSAFPRMGLFLELQSRYLKEAKGTSSAISYLQSMMKLVDHLGGGYFPCICNELGTLCNESSRIDEAAYWFKRAIAAVSLLVRLSRLSCANPLHSIMESSPKSSAAIARLNQ